MFARVSTFQGGTVDAEEALRNVREQVLPAAEQLETGSPGCSSWSARTPAGR